MSVAAVTLSQNRSTCRSAVGSRGSSPVPFEIAPSPRRTWRSSWSRLRTFPPLAAAPPADDDYGQRSLRDGEAPHLAEFNNVVRGPDDEDEDVVLLEPSASEVERVRRFPLVVVGDPQEGPDPP